jgi:hypothetical protein
LGRVYNDIHEDYSQHPVARPSGLPSAIAKFDTSMSNLYEQRSQQRRKPKCEGYIQRYAYITRNLESGPQTLFLQIYFNQTAIKKLLRLQNETFPITDKNTTSPSINYPQEKITLHITSVTNLDQYNEIARYLRTYNPKIQVDLLKINSTELELSLEDYGDLPTFFSWINTQNKLIINPNKPHTSNEINLIYQKGW